MKHVYIQHPEPEHIGYCWKCEEAKEHPSHYVIEFPTNPLVHVTVTYYLLPEGGTI